MATSKTRLGPCLKGFSGGGDANSGWLCASVLLLAPLMDMLDLEEPLIESPEDEDDDSDGRSGKSSRLFGCDEEVDLSRLRRRESVASLSSLLWRCWSFRLRGASSSMLCLRDGDDGTREGEGRLRRLSSSLDAEE